MRIETYGDYKKLRLEILHLLPVKPTQREVILFDSILLEILNFMFDDTDVPVNTVTDTEPKKEWDGLKKFQERVRKLNGGR